MTKYFLPLFFIALSFTSFAQKEYKPTKIGIVNEFTGNISGSFQYDNDAFFWINHPQLGKITFYFLNGSCSAGEDKYALPIKISDELREKFFSENEWKNLKIKVTAKSSYGIFCGGDSGIEKKVLIWRPIVVTLVN